MGTRAVVSCGRSGIRRLESVAHGNSHRKVSPWDDGAGAGDSRRTARQRWRSGLEELRQRTHLDRPRHGPRDCQGNRQECRASLAPMADATPRRDRTHHRSTQIAPLRGQPGFHRLVADRRSDAPPGRPPATAASPTPTTSSPGPEPSPDPRSRTTPTKVRIGRERRRQLLGEHEVSIQRGSRRRPYPASGAECGVVDWRVPRHSQATPSPSRSSAPR
jgi:hypothetical protein